MTERKGSMLTEKRQKEILRFLDEKGSVTVQELTERLDGEVRRLCDKCSVPCIEADGERIPGYFDRRRIESRDGGDRRKRSVCQSSEI